MHRTHLIWLISNNKNGILPKASGIVLSLLLIRYIIAVLTNIQLQYLNFSYYKIRKLQVQDCKPPYWSSNIPILRSYMSQATRSHECGTSTAKHDTSIDGSYRLHLVTATLWEHIQRFVALRTELLRFVGELEACHRLLNRGVCVRESETAI